MERQPDDWCVTDHDNEDAIVRCFKTSEAAALYRELKEPDERNWWIVQRRHLN